MKKSVKITILILIVTAVIVSSIFIYYNVNISGTRDSNEVKLVINDGDTYSSLVDSFYENKLIKNKLVYKVYLKLHSPSNLQSGKYKLNTNMGVKELISSLESGKNIILETKTITFVEGKNMRYFISKVTESLAIKESDITSALSDSEYLDSLIKKYWFLTDDIKNKNIYYSLEGYLYPDTYEFYDTASIKDVFSSMLDNMGKKLEPYKEEVEKSNYSIHEMITLSSIIELEAGSAGDRKGVAGVFYNRLKNKWSLGSDVTTYYAAKIDLSDRDLKKSELAECNSYNTRATCMAGKLPVGPICNASVKSLEAAIEPTTHNYFYFVADKNGKTYFNKTDSEHTKTVNKLKNEGLWYQY